MARGLTPRPARRCDLDALVCLENRVFPGDRLSRRSLRHHIDASTTVMLVVGAEDALAGYCLVAFRANSPIARLYSIAVDPAHAGRGVGRALLAAAEASVVRHGQQVLRLEVRADNLGAIKLYERSGYVCFGRLEGYYEDGIDALRFEKRDIGPPLVKL